MQRYEKYETNKLLLTFFASFMDFGTDFHQSSFPNMPKNAVLLSYFNFQLRQASPTADDEVKVGVCIFPLMTMDCLCISLVISLTV